MNQANAYNLQVLDIAKLPYELIDRYAKLAPSTFRCCLLGKNPLNLATKPLAIVVEHNDVAIGLALTSFYPYGPAEIHSLYIEPDHRHQGLGTLLLDKIQQILKEQHSTSIHLRYPTGSPLESFLQSKGWKTAYLTLSSYLIYAPSFHPQWLDRIPEKLKNFTVFPWRMLRPEEKESLKKQIYQHRVPAEISPFKEEKLIEPLNSLGLRYRGEVVGWIITHRLSRDTIRYTALYIHHEYLKSLAWIALLANAIRIQCSSPVHWALFEINPFQVDKEWKRFVEKRLAPHASARFDVFQAWLDTASLRQ